MRDHGVQINLDNQILYFLLESLKLYHIALTSIQCTTFLYLLRCIQRILNGVWTCYNLFEGAVKHQFPDYKCIFSLVYLSTCWKLSRYLLIKLMFQCLYHELSDNSLQFAQSKKSLYTVMSWNYVSCLCEYRLDNEYDFNL